MIFLISWILLIAYSLYGHTYREESEAEHISQIVTENDALKQSSSEIVDLSTLHLKKNSEVEDTKIE